MRRRKDFTTSERNHVVQFLLEGSTNGNVGRGRRAEAVLKFNSSPRTISRVWAEAKKQQASGAVISMRSAKMNKRAARVQIDLQLMASLELNQRTTQRRLALAVGCSKTTVFKWLEAGRIRAHTSPLRPDLTAPNKLQRLQFSLEHVEVDRIMNTLMFKSMHNTIHIDEKWFYISKGVQRFYLTPDEIDPHRTCRNKKFITKVMFMCAVCRPIFGADGSVVFDGKIGMFPFTYRAPAKRGSKNRPAGTMETKAIDSVTKEVVRDCLINKILPTIKAKWPASESKNIFIQQDNAKPHIMNNDPLFREAATDGEFMFTLVQQPPNSPDTNVNDLGWFHAIQCLQTKNTSNTIDGLIHAVEKSYDELSASTLNNVFLSLQGCFLEIMRVKGQNRYKVPHIGKEAMIRAGTLPLNLEVDPLLVRECLLHLQEAGLNDQVEHLSNALGIQMAEEEQE